MAEHVRPTDTVVYPQQTVIKKKRRRVKISFNFKMNFQNISHKRVFRLLCCFIRFSLADKRFNLIFI